MDAYILFVQGGISQKVRDNMADIELVIKMSEEEYERLPYIDIFKLRKYIENGTLLPKGHGRLIDEERISLSGIHFETERDHAMMIGRLNSAPTIIEADTGK